MTEKFNGKADVYAKGRPGYPKAVFQLLSEKGAGKGKAVADIGAGTGIFSRGLLELEAEVFAVEPNDDMRERASKDLSAFLNFHAVKGTAERTGLPDYGMDFICAAQAFHWFDPVSFKLECRRVLRNGGKVALVWNYEIMSDPFFDDFGTLQGRFYGSPDQEPYDPSTFFLKKAENFLEHYSVNVFPNDHTCDRETFIAKALSSSAAMRPGDERYEEYTAALNEFFDRRQKNGVLTYPCETVLYVGSI